MYPTNYYSAKKVESDSVQRANSKEEPSELNWDERLEFGLGYLGLSPDEFWNMTPKEYEWKTKGLLRLEEDRFERLLINAYYGGYAMAPRSKGQKPMKPDKFVLQFVSQDRKDKLHKERIKRIKRITGDND